MASPRNGSGSEQALKAEEVALTRILHAKMTQQGCLQDGDRESVSYRIAEIMVAAKELYTKDLPRLIKEQGEGSEESVFDELAGLRMTLMHLRDLITDYDEAFLDAMTHQREADEDQDDDEYDDEDED